MAAPREAGFVGPAWVEGEGMEEGEGGRGIENASKMEDTLARWIFTPSSLSWDRTCRV